MKKKLVRILSFLLLLPMLTACVSPAEAPTEEPTIVDEVEENRFTFGTLPTVGIRYPTEGATDHGTSSASGIVDSYRVVTGKSKVESSSADIQYVMIYNPEGFDPDYPYLNSTKSTGSLNKQIVVDTNKGGLGDGEEKLGASQDDINGGLPLDELLGEGDRASTYSPVYKVGDKNYFFCYDNVSLNNARLYREFTCKYAGKHCNIWVCGTMDEQTVQDYGTQFDNYIYDSVVDAFGTPRYADSGGKVNLLYYSMPKNIGGCFCMLDLYASPEVTVDDIFDYGINVDHAILHINLDYTTYPSMQTFMRSTMAHEFQHLICGTNAFYARGFKRCDTWLNEAMSGYIEELLYPGVKAQENGHLENFYESDLVRNGQSLYNFKTSGLDFGVYGSVYLYAEYLANLAGKDVFSNFHDYWRNSYSYTLSTAEAVSESVPSSIYMAVDNSIIYPASVSFDSYEEAWMSKLTLQFYLELLNRDKGDPASFSDVDARDLLYNEVNAAELEGGGRILIALKGSNYTIPSDADSGLIYVGLDKNFNVVTDLIYK